MVLPSQKVIAKYCLNADKKCLSEDAPNEATGQWQEGKWFILYDQALNVELKSGTRFLANFRYNLNQNIINNEKTNPYKHGSKLLELKDEQAFDR